MKKAKYLALFLILAVASPSAAAEKKKRDKKGGAATEEAAPANTGPDPARQKLDAAIGLMKSENYPAAAVALYDFTETEKSFEDEAEYNLAKSLYRMGLYYSALDHFSNLLAKGPQNRFHSSALEWCLFISRKVIADERVHESIARYASADFPKEYKDEFLFHLSRFHYLRSLQIEAGVIAGNTGEKPKVKETAMGGKSFENVFEGGDDEEEPAPAAAEDEAGAKRKDGKLSFDEGLFDDEEPAPAKKDKKGKDKDKDKDKTAKKDEKPAEATPPPEPEKKKNDKDTPFALTAKEHTEQADKLIAQVNATSPFGARAKFLQGLVLYKLGKDNDALEAFKTVVRLTKPGEPEADERLRELAFFQLARTHFGAKQPSYSIFYYDKIDRDSPAWLDAIYEASWAEFRLGNFEKALGNLLTLHSPFFRDEYYPESYILKAVSYYENCRYPEAKEILTDFLKKYEPVEAELVKLTERDQGPAKYYEILDNLRSGGNELAGNDQTRAAILTQILTIALADNELKHLDASYREVDGELKSFSAQGAGFPQSRLAAQLQEALGKVRDELARDAGRAVKRTLEGERESIKTLIQQSVRIDIETSRAEQERIEASLRKEQSAPKDKDREFVEWTNDERAVWPFVGEYWRDELGTYQLTLAHSCLTQQIAQSE